VTATTAVSALTALGAAAQMGSPRFRLPRLSPSAVTFQPMRALAGLCVGILLLLAATAAIVVTVAVQMLTQILPVVLCAALVVGIVYVSRGPRGLRAVSSRPSRRTLTGPPTPADHYTYHQWGWTPTPEGRWAWVSVWIAQPAKPPDVVDTDVASGELVGA
jgi:hypothetical protein